ncbi:tetratricopeptide repeat-containing sensor histidine kinase [uncultured Kordia sp.]|uniref:tetratricopeptide repeat-containing sensor histidine kinase n=1 Tax=uncultured Kordia sp. TaxID=507699 RepID=UPI0026214A22|nr:tetratricopeptide repeat-containing sensor histidine kinase [uncultured Kordia sp.]
MYFAEKKYLLILFILAPVLLFSQKAAQSNVFTQQVLDKSTKFDTNPYFAKAKSFFVEKEWDSTLVYTMKELSTKTTKSELTDYCHFIRGISFYEKKVFKEAIKEFAKTADDFEFHNNLLMYLGSIALEQEQFTKAIGYFKKIETFSEQELLGIKKKNIEHNIGLCYLHLKQFPEAEKYLNESVRLHEKDKDTLELVGAYGDLASLYYEQYKDAEAIPYFEKAYGLAKTTNDFLLKQHTANNMAVVEEHRKNYPKSIQYYKEYMIWTDSINDQEKLYALGQAEQKATVEIKQKEVAVLKAENKAKQAELDTYLYSAIILFVMFGVSMYLYREKVKRNKIINTQKEDLDELNATKDKLFSIVSHDLRSSVNAIKTSNKKLMTTIETKDFHKVGNLLQNNSSIVNGAYNLLDNLLNWALLQTKQTRFEISKLRLTSIIDHVAYNYKAILTDKELKFENTISKKEVVYADQESLKIILRNLIDNAIKFTNPNGKITVYTHNDDPDFCQLIIEDTGIGMNETTRLELLKDTTLLAKKQHEDIIGTGLGMQLCKSMIKKNNGTFSIESELGKGTKMMVSLPKMMPS